MSYRLRRAGLGWARRLTWVREGWPTPQLGAAGPVRWQRRIPFARDDGDPVLEAGKRRNLRLAAAAFDGVEVTPTRPLSFWRTLGRPDADRGFALGLEVDSGCVVPAVGGGLCAIANALFAMAVECGWRILERHGHSVALADPRALDATIAYPHVDLRIAPRAGAAVVRVRVDGDALVLSLCADDAAAERITVTTARAERIGPWQHTRILRRVERADGTVEDAVIVDDRKRVLAPVGERLRTCTTCGEDACPTGRRARARVARAGRLPVLP